MEALGVPGADGRVLEFPRIETERLVLRGPTEADLPHMPGVFNDPEIYAYTRNIPYPYGEDDAVAALLRYRRLAAAGEALTLFPECRATGEMIGLVVLILTPDEPTAELGYALGRAWWGKGYATEAASAAVGYAFASLGVDEVNAHAMVRNPASSRVLEKVGMRAVGIAEGLCKKDGEVFDAAGFAISRAAWEAR